MAKEKYPIDNISYEKTLWSEGFANIMGLDEVGRGCLAGPVVAAGVILHPETNIQGVTDSKMVATHEARKKLAEAIKKECKYWVIKECSPEEIDRHNILRASLIAMEKCAEECSPSPDYLLVDGKIFPKGFIPHKCIVKGDLLSASIGAASILAKVYRDELMYQYHQLYPHYGWDTNVGYPTKKHYQGLREFGITPIHRKSFKLGTSTLYIPDEGEIKG